MPEKKKSSLKINLRFLLVTVLFLISIGLVFIYSSSSIFSLEKFGTTTFFLKKHLLYLAIGIVGFLTFALAPISFFKKNAPFLFLFSVGMTLLTFVPQINLKVHGSSRWLNLAGFSFQPSELLKLFLLVYLGFFLEKKMGRIKSLTYSYLPFLLILGICGFILFRQPDFGSAVTIFVTSFMVFFIAGLKESHLFITVASAIPALAAAIFFVTYRFERILIFLNPWADPRGRGYQIIQSLIAIGSGGLWGQGISYSRQKFFYLPMLHTDFIFSIIAEEVGFVGSIFIVVLYVLFCYLGLKIATQLKSPFACYTTVGFTILLSLQAVMNLMVVSGLIPTKGCGLPFISYGGSALVCNLCMIGLIANFVRAEIKQ